MSFAALNAEVDRQALCLIPHAFVNIPYRHDNNRRWYWTYACKHCGKKYEGWWHAEQICLGVLGELMLAGEKIPPRWRHNFEERRRVARRAWKSKSKK